jgi:beta-glucosidase
MGIPPFNVTILQGLQDALKDTGTTIQYGSGCADVKCPDKSDFQAALSAVHDADYVVAVMGLDSSVEREGDDRVNTTCESQPVDNLALPGCQTALIEELVSSNPRVILVLINGGPVSIPNLNSGVLAVVEAFYPGPLGGYAVADVLFGKYNPGGKMPCTVFYDTKQIGVNTDYNMSAPPGRTYRYYTGKPLFPFGYGLSYTTFKYAQLVLSASTIDVCSSISVKVSVQNVGDVPGDEVIQIYVEPPKLTGKPFIPNIQLLSFERVGLAPSANHTGNYELNAYLLSLVDDDGEHYVFPGQYTVIATGGLEDRVTATFTIAGTVQNVKECPGAPSCLAC